MNSTTWIKCRPAAFELLMSSSYGIETLLLTNVAWWFILHARSVCFQVFSQLCMMGFYSNSNMRKHAFHTEGIFECAWWNWHFMIKWEQWIMGMGKDFGYYSKHAMETWQIAVVCKQQQGWCIVEMFTGPYFMKAFNSLSYYHYLSITNLFVWLIPALLCTVQWQRTTMDDEKFHYTIQLLA